MNISELQTVIDNLAAELGVPGAIVGVVDGDTDHVVATGVTSLASPAPVTADTQFLIGSTSKTVTGTVIMRLIEDGLLSLDTRVLDLLPEFRLADQTAAEQLQVRHLLTHSGGFLGDNDESAGWNDDALEKSIAAFAELPQFFEPGLVASYSNAGVHLLGRIIEVVTGELFHVAVQRIVFDPLGMTNSFYFPWDFITRPHAVGHKLGENGLETSTLLGLTRDMAPEGGVSSTVGDQLRYARFHMRGESAGKKPVSDETRLLMQQPHMQAGPPVQAIGYPWLLTNVGDARTVRHGGNIADQQLSEFVMAPDHDLAVTVMTNSAAGKVLGQRIVLWVLEHFRGITPVVPNFTFRTGEALDEVVGSYEAGQWTNIVTRDGDDITIEMRLRQDLLDMGIAPFPTIPARVSEQDEIVVGGNAAGRLIRNGAGGVTFLHFGMRATRRI